MRFPAALRALLACTALLAVSGCADWYYSVLGEGGWPHDDHDNLYPRLGGQAGIDRAVARFTVAAASDPQLRASFAHADAARFRAYFAEQICTVAGGPCVYSGPGMIDAHADQRLTDADFAAFLQNLDAAFAGEGVDPDARRALLAKLAPMRDDVMKNGQ